MFSTVGSPTVLSPADRLSSSVNQHMCSFIPDVRSLYRYSVCSRSTKALNIDSSVKRFFDKEKDFIDLSPLSEADIKEGITWKQYYARQFVIHRNIRSSSFRESFIFTPGEAINGRIFSGIQQTSKCLIFFATDDDKKKYIHIFKKSDYSLIKEIEILDLGDRSFDCLPVIPVDGDELLAVVGISNCSIQTYSTTTGKLRDTFQEDLYLKHCIGLRNTLVGMEELSSGCNIVAYRIANKSKETILKSRDEIRCFDIRFDSSCEHRFEIVYPKNHRYPGSEKNRWMIGTCVVDTTTGMTKPGDHYFDFPVDYGMNKEEDLCELQFIPRTTKVCSVFRNFLVCIYDMLSGSTLQRLPFSPERITDQLDNRCHSISVTANNFRVFSTSDPNKAKGRYRSMWKGCHYDQMNGKLYTAVLAGQSFYVYDFSKAKTS